MFILYSGFSLTQWYMDHSYRINDTLSSLDKAALYEDIGLLKYLKPEEEVCVTKQTNTSMTQGMGNLKQIFCLD